jgi:hypothetical protein
MVEKPTPWNGALGSGRTYTAQAVQSARIIEVK